MKTLEAQIAKTAALIQEADNIVALTGAGISTPSGIPDFRSPDSGLWNFRNPMDVASIIAFRHDPSDFYSWVRPLVQKAFSAQPNPAHFALAEMEKAGKLNAIITQNIDGLHQAAHSRTVFEVHGHTREMTCLRCYRVKDARPILSRFVRDGQVPHCECGGVLKPNVILFGEQLPVQVLHQAKAAAAEADLMIVVGSSLEVAPIADLPHQALAQGIKIILINDQETYIDRRADVVIRQDLIQVLPQLADAVLTRIAT